MNSSSLITTLEQLRDAGITSDLLTTLHHFSVNGRRVGVAQALSYFRCHKSITGRNLLFAKRCGFVATNYVPGKSELSELVAAAVTYYPLEHS